MTLSVSNFVTIITGVPNTTVNSQVSVLPAASITVQLTICIPVAKLCGDSGVHENSGETSLLSLTSRTVHVTGLLEVSMSYGHDM